jgi:hypothetical protein
MTSASAIPAAPSGDFLPPIGDPGNGTARRETRRSVRTEIVIVFAVSLGISGLNSLITQIQTQIRANQHHQSLNQYTVPVAAPKSQVPLVDLFYQLTSIVNQLAWGCLGLYLLWRAGASLSRHLGLNLRRPLHDLLVSIGLAALIGIPGLGLYLLANQMGFSLTVAASQLTDTWWRMPVTVLIAFQNGFSEECLVVGYLLLRLRQLGFRMPAALAVSAVVRGSYHLYQGYGGFVGNAIMGLIFGYVFLRWRRLWPLIIAHGLIDTAALVGYVLLHGHVSWLP